MELVLLRHGKAESDHPDGDDRRSLTQAGRKQALNAARLLVASGRRPSIVLTSPLVRARETAEVFCKEAGMPGPLIQGWLACGMMPETALRELAGFNEFASVMIVGHEPDFSILAASILDAGIGSIEVRKGSLVGFDVSPPSARGTLRFLIPPKLAANRLDP